MRLPNTIAAALVALLAAAPASAGVTITVDKSAQRMSVSVDGVQKHSWPVSTGKSGYKTPAGNFTAFRMEEDHYSKEWDDAPMPHSIFFTKEGHAIHGSFETKRLGSPASHGCVRLAPANAATLFALVKAEGVTSTKVVISGTEGTAVAKRRAPRSTQEADGMFSSNPYGQHAGRDPSAPQLWPDPYGERPSAGAYAHAQRQQQQQQRHYQQRLYDQRFMGQTYEAPQYGQRGGSPYASGYYRNGW